MFVGESSFAKSYPPSIVDHFIDWVERIPIPWWAFYLGLAFVLISIEVALMWNGRNGGIAPYPLAQVAILAYSFALMDGLNRLAGRAMTRFRPLLNASESEYQSLCYKLTTLPPRPVWRAMLCGAIFGAAIFGVIPAHFLADELGYAISVPSVVYNVVINAMGWAAASALIYHTAHQLGLVHQITLRARGINLFALNSIYAFSVLSAATAIGYMGMTLVLYGVSPTLLSQFLPVAILVFFTILSFTAFVLPLRGARAVLAKEKSQRLRETGDRMAALYTELHRRVDAGEMANMSELNQALASLEMERTALNHVSALPWPKDLFRVVTLALFTPLLWWAVDKLLTALAGP